MSSSDKTVLVTGGAGFIGSNFIHLLLTERPSWRVICMDSLTYAGNLANLTDYLENKNFRFVKCDICDRQNVADVFADGVDMVVNFAAETHVDRSIHSSDQFVQTNIVGTQVLLDAAKQSQIELFLQVSTDEVYGSLGDQGYFTEQTPLAPNSPYSASKAAADLFVRAYSKTYNLPTVITRCSNNYGPYQFPEKLIPLFVTNLLADKKVPVYGDGMQVRDWLHVEDHCEALLAVLEKAKPGDLYNIGGNNDRANIEVVKILLECLGKDESMIEYVKDRPGHDRRYAIDCSKIEEALGWEPKIDFAEGLAQTVDWYIQNESWWQAIKTGEYLKYYEKQYGAAL